MVSKIKQDQLESTWKVNGKQDQTRDLVRISKIKQDWSYSRLSKIKQEKARSTEIEQDLPKLSNIIARLIKIDIFQE